MNKILKLIVTVLSLVMLILPVLGEMGGMDMGTMNNDSMRGKAKEMHEIGSKMREKVGMRGMGFMHSEGNSFGDYVTFSVDNKTGLLMDFGISGITVFDSIRVSNFDIKDIKTMGAITRTANKDDSVVIQLHDNPAAVINIMAKTKATVIFNLSQGVNATKEDNIVKITVNNLTAYIASANATSVNIAGSQVRIETDKGITVFRTSPVNIPIVGMHSRFMQEIMKKRAGAEVFVGSSDKSSIINYSDDINVMIKPMEKNRMRMMINSSDHSGKFLMMNIDNSSLMWNERQKLSLYLDNEPMRQVMTEQELYNTKESSFWLMMPGQNRMQSIMYIQNFSERQVDIVVEGEGTPMATPESTITGTTTVASTPKTPGFEVMLGMLCTVVAYRFRKKV